MDASDLSLVEIGLARVHPDDAHVVDVVDPHPRPDQILEVQVPDVARVVVAGNGQQRSLDPIGVGEPRLVLRAETVGRQVARDDDHARLELIQLGDHAVHQVGHEMRRPDVRVRDVRDRDHGSSLSSLAAAVGRRTHLGRHRSRPRTPGCGSLGAGSATAR